MADSEVAAVNLKLETELDKKPALEANDTTALTEKQQQRLDVHKIKTRLENEKYLREHPEITIMLSSFISNVLLKRPEKIREYAAGYFTDPELPDKVRESLEVNKK